jgi:hypothetical protein
MVRHHPTGYIARMNPHHWIGVLLASATLNCSNIQTPVPVTEAEMAVFTEDLKERTFRYFWEVVDSVNYQTDDRHPTRQFTSIAATGFAYPAYIIGVENGYVTREAAADRIRKSLEWLWNSEQGDAEHGMTGHRGFFYHFLTYGDGVRYKDVELSTIDTALLIAGVLTAQSYFDADTPDEARIRELAEALYRRIDWRWAMNGNPTMSMGWKPESGFITATWAGYNEAMILLVLALGSPTHALPPEAWDAWTSTYNWDTYYGFEHVNFGPLFGHQYSHMFIDFKGIQDAYMRDKGLDYFENSRRATLSQQAYAKDNPHGFAGYGEWNWGWTACDGPANRDGIHNGHSFRYHTYYARGMAADYHHDDGTITPTAAGGSIPFAPDVTLRTLYEMKKTHGDSLYRRYGFADSFNMTYRAGGWYNPDYIGIDQGPILVMLENHQTGLIWNILKRNPHIVRGLTQAGFTGGWLETEANPF